MEQRLNELVVPIHKASQPILLNLDIKGLNLKNLLEGKVHFDFQAEEFGLNMLPVQIGQASGSYTGGKINFDKIILIYSSRYNNYKLNKKKIFNIIELHFINILLTKLKK